MNEIINKVATSSLIQIDLENFYPQGERILYDLKDNLFQGLILREKDFRAFLKEHDWANYQNKHVAITCTADAIVPTWAYMLLAAHLEPFATTVVFGTLETLETELFRKTLEKLDLETYKDAKIVIKGCSKNEVPLSAYVEIMRLLRPIATSIMFGEPCSTVPLYKKK
jgi:hypothetical protein